MSHSDEVRARALDWLVRCAVDLETRAAHCRRLVALLSDVEQPLRDGDEPGPTAERLA